MTLSLWQATCTVDGQPATADDLSSFDAAPDGFPLEQVDGAVWLVALDDAEYPDARWGCTIEQRLDGTRVLTIEVEPEF